MTAYTLDAAAILDASKWRGIPSRLHQHASTSLLIHFTAEPGVLWIWMNHFVSYHRFTGVSNHFINDNRHEMFLYWMTPNSTKINHSSNHPMWCKFTQLRAWSDFKTTRIKVLKTTHSKIIPIQHYGYEVMNVNPSLVIIPFALHKQSCIMGIDEIIPQTNLWSSWAPNHYHDHINNLTWMNELSTPTQFIQTLLYCPN